MTSVTLRQLPTGSGSKLGLVGIGLMGTSLAERLLAANVQVIGWDRLAKRRAALEEAGGTSAESLQDVFSRCDRVLLSLPSHEIVNQVLQSVQGVLRSGQIIFDTSTGDPDAAVAQGEALRRLGIEYLDATISGSSQQALDGTAIFLVGASDFAYISCLDVFEWLSFKAYHTGPVGTGARMKLVTNLVLGLNRAALAEGLWFAKSLGLDLDQSLFLLRESMAYSRIMDSKGEKMVQGDFSPQAKLSQHLKDVCLMQSAARQSGAILPMTEAHRSLLETAMTMGLGDLDNSAILQAIEKQV